MRLCLNTLPQSLLPAYDPEAHGIGILHLGLGAFHRAHQAAYTDDALAAEGGDWRILGVSLRSTDIIDALAAQDGLFTLTERADTDRTRVIAAIGETLAAARDSEAVRAALARPEIRVITLTVTEKAYGIDRAAMDIDPAHPDVDRDLKDPRHANGVLALLVEGLRRRQKAGLPAPAILCCDNLPENGALLRAGVLGFARRIDAGLAEWIAANVAFPSSMVDRITPAATDATADRIKDLFGVTDTAAIECEAFSQWVIEDNFPQGRPAWDAAGALFVQDVAPYERMKLRMLNGAHSLIAYAGFIAGHEFVRDAMQDAPLVALVDRHMKAAAAGLGALGDIDLDAYRHALLARFANRSIAHQTYQIAMDGTEKLPQRIFAPALEAGTDIDAFAFATAAWMRYCTGIDEQGRPYDLRDPRAAEIHAALKGATTAGAICDALIGLPDLFPKALKENPSFRQACTDRLQIMLARGMTRAIAQEPL
ncbi:mannitol dehydrogenase family protein (plasmid) [Pseudorhodobacter turbinis]|uniref:Mannitol dehydrogenase family protein n=1 Tax=Pseudorhodobacter turbinis TaxID=2500533 RepID=A0A4P8ELZ9_9RHOB|nr:mannitol dehydrogenase family protein [Pseudorhodobacter turbinis]QCO57912.1 mannitol dehydrogenase family protein [Pseudorhodobacter turbinis]